jgi:16S rRNA G966 N2-methylase RsmD
MMLFDSEGALINVDTPGPIEDSEHMEKSKPDMASYIEEATIDAGTYTLTVEIPRAYFLPTKEFNTCLGFELNIEYVHRSNTGNMNYQQAGLPQQITETTPFDVISIRPPYMKHLSMHEQLSIKVAVDRDLTIADIAKDKKASNEVC